MTRQEYTAFNNAVKVEGVRAYWQAVSDAVQQVAKSVPANKWDTPVDSKRLNEC
jgi:hypothetical protein